jgi:hypothetical protein
MWRVIRISVLLIVLATITRQMFLEKADLDWKDNFYVALYPINADGSDKVAQYISTLVEEDFESMETFFAEEAARYNVGMRQPIAVELGGLVEQTPPPPPLNGNVIQTMLWSLSFRLFAWNNSPHVPVKPDIKLYLLFYDPGTHKSLTHSTALNKGRVGRVNLFGNSSYTKQNLVIVAHELLHTLTATDKYNLATGSPLYPDGYAEPDKQPLYPQHFAELMGGYVPVSESEKKTPASLSQTLIGYKTAREIGWVK